MADKDMHESVAGIVAGRVRDAVNRPCVVLTSGDSAMKGSGRSVDGFDLYAALYAHRHLFVRFGGHAMAAGLTLPEENIAALRQGLNADCRLADEDFILAVDVDRVLEPQDITLALSDELVRLAPFGKGNPEPLFVGYGLTIESTRVIDDKNTLIFSLAVPGGKPLKGIAFGLNEKYNERFKSMDALFAIETNVYNGTVSVQIRIKDFSYAGD
jgi:single-stranded-DNA-specific exonuclease